jgi:hypothetical protein
MEFGYLKGRVMTEDNVPIKGARIALSALGVTETKSKGDFLLLFIRPGTSMLSVEARGMIRLSVNIHITQGENDVETLILSKSEAQPATADRTDADGRP